MLQRRSSEAKQQRMNTCNRQRTLLTVVGLFKQPCIVPFYLTMVILVTACLIRRSQVAGHVSNQEINFMNNQKIPAYFFCDVIIGHCRVPKTITFKMRLSAKACS